MTVEALLSLLIACGFLLTLEPLAAHPGYENVYRQQLAQDFAEVTLKNKALLGDAIGFAETGQAPLIKEEFGRALNALGGYCVVLEARGKSLEVNCVEAGLDADSPVAGKIAVDRMVFDGEGFFDLRLALLYPA